MDLVEEEGKKTCVAIYVAEMMVVVATKIVLHSSASIDEEVVVRLVETTAVIVVNIFLRRIVILKIYNTVDTNQSYTHPSEFAVAECIIEREEIDRVRRPPLLLPLSLEGAV